MKLLVTGGLGFIGSAVVRHFASKKEFTILNVDKGTYAGNPASVSTITNNKNYKLFQEDIADGDKIREAFVSFKPDIVLHLAAESHVDRSIDTPENFINTNLVGTYSLLNNAFQYWSALNSDYQQKFKFIHVSTDEVFGSLGKKGKFNENFPYNPSSPYSASKAGSDHLARAWQETYGLPVIVTNCSNNYGPYQFPEKLIPLMILKGLEGKPMPVYGEGKNIRDWLHVDDHVAALEDIIQKGEPGETYNIGGNSEYTNIEVVETICGILDKIRPDHTPHKNLISYVKDRPGHDFRYSMDINKISRELGWKPRISFEIGLENTVKWYLENTLWWQAVLDGSYRLERLGNR
ncbi:MAG: dTDP-glucose 4,6-dehydratase [Pseudomonadota bacterium]|nr:dTDP-glucose 4,6-dehydratase [Pseudomonadota bacterium]